jgi:hypothetical protein
MGVLLVAMAGVAAFRSPVVLPASGQPRSIDGAVGERPSWAAWAQDACREVEEEDGEYAAEAK